MKLYESIIITVGAVAIATCTSCYNITGANKRAAEEHAHEWATDVRLDVSHIVCGSSDTDHDGYVSCTFHVGEDVRTFECAGYSLIMPHDGCREPKVKIPARR